VIEGDFEVVQESIHPEESRNGQIFRKAGSNVYDSPGHKEHDVVKIVAGDSIGAEGFFERVNWLTRHSPETQSSFARLGGRGRPPYVSHY